MYIHNDTCQIKNLELIYEKYFPHKSTFVDVGASDGVSFSNTFTLANARWRGLCVEPVPEQAERCRNLHLTNSLITVVEACVGKANGETKLYLGGCPTISEEVVERNPYGFTYDPENFIMRNMYTLDALLLKHAIPVGFGLLSIDVEGAEPLVLEGFHISLWKPQMVIIETHIGHPQREREFNTAEIVRYFAEAKYYLLQRDTLNDIYLREDIE
jgi:FkbM family methyltransferase